jgi:GTP-binding protein
MIAGVIAIVGSPNAGKSSLFNRFIGSRLSIVDDLPGLTRDRLYGKVTWLTKDFRIIDTGGIQIENKPFQIEIRAQVEIAIKEADAILFVVDGQLGITRDDRQVAKMLYQSKKKIIVAVNKIDSKESLPDVSEFYQLGFGEPIAVSGVHGIGIGDVLDAMVKALPTDKEVEDYEGLIKFCVVGRPNVGKSSLVNAILNEERVIVSPIEGTTRDAIDTTFKKENQGYVVIDTAGLKRRGKIYEAVDKYAALRALRAIDRSDIALLVIDAERGITEQDKHIAGYAFDARKAMMIVVNKWDAVPASERNMDAYKKKVQAEFQFLDFAPIVFVSAKNKSRIETIFQHIHQIYEAYHHRVNTSLLNGIIIEAQLMNQTPDFNGGRLKIYYANQVSVAPPTFVLFVNSPEYLHFSYARYLENRLRSSFNFMGTPIVLIARERK